MTTAETSDLLNLRSVVLSNLQHQHYWTDIKLLDTQVDIDENTQNDPLPRPMIYGQPPEQLYNPEPASSTNEASSSEKPPADKEYVLPVHLTEKLTLRTWASVFDNLPTPSGAAEGGEGGGDAKKKRIVVAVVSGDSTVVYYIMHDGIVKPRQN
ncbi:hypothetical protein TWF970_000459 [Orbilia oligospora]|uniref:tRNA-splicing endonuclease subunit Sen15 domain-containing protein n=1 Tax=Orbilia oligospora TaxID=2813651 RepID=A0A7C8VPK7_ORBOL|nr:hypothetical protein TWF970_000459 [Orbilia oligospora]KAF3291232.1 hypothetical protein TWF970_000459 [Orbilia oligospora]